MLAAGGTDEVSSRPRAPSRAEKPPDFLRFLRSFRSLFLRAFFIVPRRCSLAAAPSGTCLTPSRLGDATPRGGRPGQSCETLPPRRRG